MFFLQVLRRNTCGSTVSAGIGATPSSECHQGEHGGDEPASVHHCFTLTGTRAFATVRVEWVLKMGSICFCRGGVHGASRWAHLGDALAGTSPGCTPRG